MGKENSRPVLCVVMDGVGVNPSRYGNAVLAARTPYMSYLRRKGLYLELQAHGKAVGLPSDQDMGNSEVGHNALGAGRVFDQGAKLVQNAIANGSLFEDDGWKRLVGHVIERQSTLHLIGLLSDGNVHSHQDHLHALVGKAKEAGVRRVRIHALLDGRDVGERSAEVYCDRLESFLTEVREQNFDVEVASGGGRMVVTMDRYEADWKIVERGWKAHVLGEAADRFSSLSAAIMHYRKTTNLSDQNFPAFVIEREQKPVGEIVDGDAVVCFNFRGDRAIEISRAFEEATFTAFDRKRYPKVFYAAMMEYDGDLHIPKNYLVRPPEISRTMGAFLCEKGYRQFACSETQKYGHVTYFWNGNRSGYFDKTLEEYVEIPSDLISFDLKPAMKAYEIAEATIARMHRRSFDFARINFANGDMVGHTGNFEAAVIGVSVVDQMLGMLLHAAQQLNVTLLVTADHGNCDEMFDVKDNGAQKDWQDCPIEERPRPKTSHTLSPVPCYIYDPQHPGAWKVKAGQWGLANVAASCLSLMGINVPEHFEASFVEPRK